ncbi:MAG: hypothetical protein LPK03_09195 [Pontibacter sp.]|nr:hypothetical protein [Pontibacter sp.]
MNCRLSAISGLTLSLLTAMVAGGSAALAQDFTEPQTIPDALDEQFFNSSGTYFENRTISRQAAHIFGFGFAEREIDWDANTIAEMVDNLFLLQNTTDPTIRVPDLANPYTTTLLTMPSATSPTVGTEFIFE